MCVSHFRRATDLGRIRSLCEFLSHRFPSRSLKEREVQKGFYAKFPMARCRRPEVLGTLSPKEVVLRHCQMQGSLEIQMPRILGALLLYMLIPSLSVSCAGSWLCPLGI